MVIAGTAAVAIPSLPLDRFVARRQPANYGFSHALLPAFADGPVVVGPVAKAGRRGERDHPGRAERAAGRAGWPAAPRPVTADALLPERALPATPRPASELVRAVYRPLRQCRRRAVRDGHRPSWTPAARWKRPHGRCSCTPTRSATGCAGWPRSAARPRPTRAARSRCGSRWPCGRLDEQLTAAAFDKS